MRNTLIAARIGSRRRTPRIHVNSGRNPDTTTATTRPIRQYHGELRQRTPAGIATLPPPRQSEDRERPQRQRREAETHLFQVGADVLRIGIGQEQAVESAECEPEQQPAREALPAEDSMKREPADERNEREQIGDRVDAHSEHETQHQPTDKQTVGREVRRKRRCIRERRLVAGVSPQTWPKARHQLTRDEAVNDDRQAAQQNQLARGFAVSSPHHVKLRLHKCQCEYRERCEAGANKTGREASERQQRERTEERVAVQHAVDAGHPAADRQQHGRAGHELRNDVRTLLIEPLRSQHQIGIRRAENLRVRGHQNRAVRRQPGRTHRVRTRITTDQDVFGTVREREAAGQYNNSEGRRSVPTMAPRRVGRPTPTRLAAPGGR